MPTLEVIVNLSNFIAKRYLFSKKSKSIINIISLISVVGVFVSSAAMIVVLSGFNGIERLVENIYSEHEADIVITPLLGKTFHEIDSVINKINSFPEIKNFSRVIEEVTMVKHGDRWMTAIMKGVEKSYIEISKLDSSIIEGNSNYWNSNLPNAIIGVGLQNQLQVSSDKRFNNQIIIYGLLREEKISISNKSVFKPAEINVTGIFNVNPEFDEKYLIVPIDFARELLNYENEINAIEIELNTGIDPTIFKSKLKNVLSDAYLIKTQYEKNELIYKTNAAEKWMVFMILIFIFILSTFNIIASLTMLILDKKKDISTLISLGATPKLIKSIFFKEGFYINLLGGGLGLTIGALLCILQGKFKLIKLENSVIDHWPVIVELSDLFSVLFILIFVGILSSYLPTAFIIKRHFKTYFN
jgi:lipoprotein-releasing system permease protein